MKNAEEKNKNELAWKEIRKWESERRMVTKEDTRLFSEDYDRPGGEGYEQVLMLDGNEIGSSCTDTAVRRKVDEMRHESLSCFDNVAKVAGRFTAADSIRGFQNLKWVRQFQKWLDRNGVPVRRVVRLRASPVTGMSDYGFSVQLFAVGKNLSVEVTKVDGTKGLFVSVTNFLGSSRQTEERAFPTIIAAKNFVRSKFLLDTKKNTAKSLKDFI